MSQISDESNFRNTRVDLPGPGYVVSCEIILLEQGVLRLMDIGTIAQQRELPVQIQVGGQKPSNLHHLVIKGMTGCRVRSNEQ